MGREEQIVNERLRKLKELKVKGINPYPHNFDKKSSCSEALKFKLGAKVKTAGRIMTKRGIGKIIFSDLTDNSGKIQIVFQDKESPGKVIDFFKKYVDVGDFVGIEGKIIKTKTKQISILVKKLEILGKSIFPLPSKWHGLQDKEDRYRRRYLDLVMNPQVKEVFEKRALIIDEIKNFLKGKGFIEVETPLLQPLYGGAEARPFMTNLYALNMDLYLSISPELYLKRLIAGGFEKVFTISKNFRNEGIDRLHNPEFTMIEWYDAYKDYKHLMKMTENLLSSLAKKIHKKTKIDYQGKTIDFKTPFKRITMADAVKKYAGVDPKKLSPEKLNEIFEEKVEAKLIQPTFVIDYPLEICPLTKEHRENENLVERFELFINGSELANAYSELNDPIEQEIRLNKQVQSRKKAKDYDAHFEATVIDEDFVKAMSYGMPPLGGIGIGIDRLVMLLTNQQSIRDVILFPFMKPEKQNDSPNK